MAAELTQAEKILRQVEYYFSDNSYPFDEFMKSLAATEGKDNYIDLSVLCGALLALKRFSPTDPLPGKTPRLHMTTHYKSQSSDSVCLSSRLLVRKKLPFPIFRMRALLPHICALPPLVCTIQLTPAWTLPLYIFLCVRSGFGKMKTLLGDAADPVSVVAAALGGSDSVELNAAKDGARRMFPVPSEDPAASRTVWTAQFDSEASRAKLAETFGGFGAAVESVRPQRNLAADDRHFDGSAFVAFASEGGEAAVAAAVAAAAAGEILGTSGAAEVKTLAKFFDDFSKKRLGMKKKRDDEASAEGSRKRKAEAAPFDETYPRGLVAKVTNLASVAAPAAAEAGEGEGAAAGVDREAVKAGCEAHGIVGWVEYERGGAEAVVRFNEASAAAAAAAAGVVVAGAGEGGAAVPCAVLDGDEERAYWLRKHEDSVARKKGKGGRRGGKGGKGKGKGKGRR